MCLFSTIVFLYGYLRNFRQFYLTYPNPEIYYTVCSKLTWSHNRLIMGMNDANACCFYLKEVTRQETFRILHTAIDKLPAQSKQIIMLSMEGLSNAEVGEKLGISVNTVKTLKKNAYAVLRQVLSKEYLLLLFVILRDYSA